MGQVKVVERLNNNARSLMGDVKAINKGKNKRALGLANSKSCDARTGLK